MAYDTAVITDLNDAITELETFATGAGWTAAAGSFTPPGGGEAVTITRISSGVFEGLDLAMPSQTTNTARCNSPQLNGSLGVPASNPPSAIQMFAGEEEGVPFLAAAIDFSGAGWRHIYIGGVVPVDAGTPGRLVAANWHFTSQSSSGWPRDTRVECKWLFGAYNQVLPRENSGFAYMPFGSGDDIRPNRTSSAADAIAPPESTMGVDTLIGGAFDGVNDALAAYGQVHFASATLLVPIQLYVTEGAPARIRPVGHAAGVRMVNLTNYNPAQQILIGADAWRVIPEFAKANSHLVNRGTQYGENESSGQRGLAYPEAMET